MDAVDLLSALAVLLFGLALGSFLNVCLHRLPRGLSVVSPGSACPSCGRPIPARDNIPVLSWLLLRGRCRHCRARISPRYAAVELLTAALFLVFFLHFGPTLQFVKFCLFAFLLLGLIFTDAAHKLLPDAFTLPGLLLGVAFSLVVPLEVVAVRGLLWLAGLPALVLPWRLLSLAESLLGAAVGAGLIYAAGALYLRLRGVEGMGFGDVKLMAMVGAFLGAKLTLFTLFAASLLGSLFGLAAVLNVWIKRARRHRRRGRAPAEARRRAWISAQLVYRHYEMPFGVFLGSMALLAALLGDPILRWYLESFF
jgi:leader peptidase (prepilin peptidase) / N-methyltransferase